jgi:hypothetical protein
MIPPNSQSICHENIKTQAWEADFKMQTYFKLIEDICRKHQIGEVTIFNSTNLSLA